MSHKNTIIIKSAGTPVYKELVANAAITPGMLVEPMSTGKVRAHATAKGNAIPMFAIEDALQGNGVDDAYAALDPVRCWYPQRGDEVYALLADGQSVNQGDYLESDGSGHLQKRDDTIDEDDSVTTIYPNAIVARALEAKDTSTSSGEESTGGYGAQRIKVEIV